MSAPYSELEVNRILSPKLGPVVTASLHGLSTQGFDKQQIATTLEMLLHDRSDGQQNEPPIDLVTSGPEAPGLANRDTAVVVRELFAHAKKSVLIVGYAVYQGRSVFEALAHRMEEIFNWLSNSSWTSLGLTGTRRHQRFPSPDSLKDSVKLSGQRTVGCLPSSMTRVP